MKKMTNFANEKISCIPEKIIFQIKHQIKHFLFLSEKLVFYTSTKKVTVF